MKIVSFKGSLQVRMSEEGKKEYYHQACNPHDQVGYVLNRDSRGGLNIQVQWADGVTNSYSSVHLEPVMFPEAFLGGF